MGGLQTWQEATAFSNLKAGANLLVYSRAARSSQKLRDNSVNFMSTIFLAATASQKVASKFCASAYHPQTLDQYHRRNPVKCTSKLVMGRMCPPSLLES